MNDFLAIAVPFFLAGGFFGVAIMALYHRRGQRRAEFRAYREGYEHGQQHGLGIVSDIDLGLAAVTEEGGQRR